MFFLYFKFTRTHNSITQKSKNSKLKVQNETQTLRKSYAFLNNNNNNNNSNNHNNNVNNIENMKQRKE